MHTAHQTALETKHATLDRQIHAGFQLSECGLLILRAPCRCQFLCSFRIHTTPRKGQITNLYTLCIELIYLTVQLLAVETCDIREYGDVITHRALGREHHHIVHRNSCQLLFSGDGTALLSEIHSTRGADLMKISVQKEVVAIGRGI